MKKKTYLLNVILTVVMAAGVLAAMLVKTFESAAVLPAPNIPNLTLISLIALVADHFLAPGEKRNWLLVGVFSLLSFLLLPWASGLVTGWPLMKLALCGCVVFMVCTLLFSSMADRISTGQHDGLTVIISALGILMASQAFNGMIL